MELSLFNNIICNVQVADAKLANWIKCQSILQRSLSEDNKNNPSDLRIASQVAPVMYCMRCNAATKAQFLG